MRPNRCPQSTHLSTAERPLAAEAAYVPRALTRTRKTKTKLNGQCIGQRPASALRKGSGPPAALDLGETVVALDKGLPEFPKDPHEAPLVIERLLIAAGRPMDAAELARGFKRGGKRIEQRITQALTTLARYGNIIALDGGRYASRRVA